MGLEVEERIVAGEEDDLVLVHHLVLRGSNRAIGRHLGEIARARYHAQPIAADDPLRVRVQREWFRRHYPALFERMHGLAEAFGVDLADDAYDLSALRPGPTACAMIFVPPRVTAGTRPLVSRTFDACAGPRRPATEVGCDLLPATRPYVLELHPDGGHASLVLTTYDLLSGALDGLNAEGLCVSVAVDEEARAAGAEPTGAAAVGLDELQLVRFLLDGCANAGEAREAALSAKHYYAHAPAHYLVADRHGDAFAFEYGVGHNREHVIDAAGLPLVITNHPLHRYPDDARLPRADGPGATYARWRRLSAALAETPAPYDADALRRVAARAFIEPGADPEPQPPVRTLWHGIYDLRERSLEASFFLRDEPDPSRQGLKRSVRSPVVRFALA